MVWKFILLAFTAQPIPANDAFGYDGAVVNYLLNGHYCNPSLAIPFPFSGTRIFCIYPPLYQAVLFLWMSVFGPTVLSAMWFHLVLFGLFLLTLLAIFRRLQTPAWAVNLAGLFLFGITFDDRPDGLAQLLGMLALYAWLRSVEPPARTQWTWLAAVLVVLTLCTNPEIGGLYFGLVWLLTLWTAWRTGRFPFAPMGFLVLAPLALVALVKYGRPDLWAGFLEHAGQTSSFTNLRRPSPGDLLKLVRTIPAILLIAPLLLKFPFQRLNLSTFQPAVPVGGVPQVSQPAVTPIAQSAGPAEVGRVRWSNGLRVGKPAIQQTGKSAVRGKSPSSSTTTERPAFNVSTFQPVNAPTLLFSAVLASLGLTVGALFLFTSNWILFLAYFQPLIVGLFLLPELLPTIRADRWLVPALLGLALLVAVRAMGLTTWGVACAWDVNEAAALQIVRADLDKLPPQATVVMSSAYLYEAMKHPGLTCLHEDWTHPNRPDADAGGLTGDAVALLKLKPAALILTQFDYYRRYCDPKADTLTQLRGLPDRVTFKTTNYARVPVPDASPRFRQVVQHVAWAPVIVEFDWKP